MAQPPLARIVPGEAAPDPHGNGVRGLLAGLSQLPIGSRIEIDKTKPTKTQDDADDNTTTARTTMMPDDGDDADEGKTTTDEDDEDDDEDAATMVAIVVVVLRGY